MGSYWEPRNNLETAMVAYKPPVTRSQTTRKTNVWILPVVPASVFNTTTSAAGAAERLTLETHPADFKLKRLQGLSLNDLAQMKCAGRSCWRNKEAFNLFYNAVRIYWRITGRVATDYHDVHNHNFLDVDYKMIRVIRNLFSAEAYVLLDQSRDAQTVIVKILSAIYPRHWNAWVKANNDEARFKEQLRVGGQLEGFYNNLKIPGEAPPQWLHDLRDWARAAITAALPWACPLRVPNAGEKRGRDEYEKHGEKRGRSEYEEHGEEPRKILPVVGRKRHRAARRQERQLPVYTGDDPLTASASSTSMIGDAADNLIAQYRGSHDDVEHSQMDEMVPEFARFNIQEIGCSKEDYLKVDIEYIRGKLHEYPQAVHDPEVIYYWRKLQAKANEGLWLGYWKVLHTLENLIGGPLREGADPLPEAEPY